MRHHRASVEAPTTHVGETPLAPKLPQGIDGPQDIAQSLGSESQPRSGAL